MFPKKPISSGLGISLKTNMDIEKKLSFFFTDVLGQHVSFDTIYTSGKY